MHCIFTGYHREMDYREERGSRLLISPAALEPISVIPSRVIVSQRRAGISIYSANVTSSLSRKVPIESPF